MKYNIHPDFKKVEFNLPFNNLFFIISRLPQKLLWSITKIPKEIRLKKIKINNLKIYEFSPKKEKEALPCILYFHGGSFVFKAAFHHKILLSEYALKANCKVWLLDYSLMPRNIYPVAEKEALEAYKYILKDYKNRKIDKEKIAIGGDSVGGYLAITLCNQIKKLKLIKPIMQLLIYPATFPKEKTDSIKKYVDTPRWNSRKNRKMWNDYFKNTNFIEQEKSYLENREILDIRTYIELTEYDPLHDEGLLYANKLKNENVPVEVVDTKQTIHGYDINLKSSITKENIRKRIKFLKDGFK